MFAGIDSWLGNTVKFVDHFWLLIFLLRCSSLVGKYCLFGVGKLISKVLVKRFQRCWQKYFQGWGKNISKVVVKISQRLGQHLFTLLCDGEASPLSSSSSEKRFSVVSRPLQF